VINITRRTLGVLVIKPAKGGAQLSVNAAGNPSQIKVRLDIARQGPPGPVGGVGSGSSDLQVAAAVALSGHVAVVLNAAGAALPADPSNALHGAAVVGITRGAAALGDSVALASQGSLEHLGWTFTPDLPIYLGASGALVQSAPIGASFLKVLGMAQSPTRITVSIQPAIYIN
jgi:hypothetical protein